MNTNFALYSVVIQNIQTCSDGFGHCIITLFDKKKSFKEKTEK